MNAPFSTFQIGRGQDKAPVSLDFAKTQNFHVLAIGASGSGKTYLLRRLIAFLASQGVTIHILDTQGDYAMESFELAGIRNDYIQTRLLDFLFNYDTESCGLNPLLLSDHPQSGGVYMNSLEFAQIARIFNSNLSKVQESMLIHFLEETYRRKGIEHDRIDTWRLPSPTLEDLDQLMAEALDLLADGFGKADINMRGMIRVYNRVRDSRDRIIRLEERLESDKLKEGDAPVIQQEIEAVHKKITKDLDAWTTAANRFVVGGALGLDDGEGGSFEDHLQNWRSSSISSLRATTHGMLSSRLFSGTEVRPQKGYVNRYDLKALGERDQLAMIRVLLSKIFNRAMRTTSASQLNSNLPTDFIVLDEGKIAAATSNQQMSALNRIATEGRKFGLGMIVGVQSPDHITDDLRVNCATKFVLSVDPGAYPDLKRNLGVPPDRMRLIAPRRDALVSINGGMFSPVHLFA